MYSPNKFLISCFGITIILGFIAFGYILFQFIGYWTFLPTCVFIFLSIAGIKENNKEIEGKATRAERNRIESWN